MKLLNLDHYTHPLVKKAYATLIVVCASVTLAACGGGDGNNTVAVAAASGLVNVGTEAAGANCALGGSSLQTGLDSNANGTLEAAEITSTQYVCNGAGMNWVNVTGTSVQAQPNTGYLANNAAQVSVNLPTAPNVGDVVEVNGAGAGGWKITQNPGQSVQASSILQNLVFGKPLVTRDAARNWQSIASSLDGSKLVAVVQGGQIYTSTDAGLTWTARDSARSWSSVASSSDGSMLVAVVQNGQIYTSSDVGLTWTARDSVRMWRSVASSSDGSMLVAVAISGQIYTSSDAGLTWTPRDTVRNWISVASSSDGNKLIATEYSGQIYTSADAGISWKSFELIRPWRGATLSADGNKVAIFGTYTQIYISTPATSSLGLNGSVSGTQYSALSLQYLGSGVFNILNHEGSDFTVQ